MTDSRSGDRPPPPRTPPFSPEFLERYRLLGILGEGGMGTVYRAVQVRLDRPVAIKVLKIIQTDLVARFRREGLTLASLRHPNIVEVLDAGVDSGASGDLPYLVTELIEGRTLEEAFDEERWTLGRALGVLMELGRALAHAHGAGVVHRDVKPENAFLLPYDAIKLSDFGLARVKDAKTLTQAGVIMGTPAYMAPEQVRGGAVGPAADQYALGVILYRFLAGRLPFEAPDPLKQAMARLSSDPAPLPAHPAVPQQLRDLCHRTLQREPDDRFPSIESLIEALESIQTLAAGALEEALPRAAGRIQVRPPAADGVTLGGPAETIAPAETAAPALRAPEKTPTTAPPRSRSTGRSSRTLVTAPATERRIGPWIFALPGMVVLALAILAVRTYHDAPEPPIETKVTPSLSSTSPHAERDPLSSSLIADIEKVQEALDGEDDPVTYLAPQRLARIQNVLTLLDRATAPDLEDGVHVRLITVTRDIINEIFEDQTAVVKSLTLDQVDEAHDQLRKAAGKLASGSGPSSVRALLGAFIPSHIGLRNGLEELEHSWKRRWEYARLLDRILVVLKERENDIREGPPRWIEIVCCGYDCGKEALQASSDSEITRATDADPKEKRLTSDVQGRAQSVYIGSRLALYEVAPLLTGAVRGMSAHRRNDSQYKTFRALGEIAGHKGNVRRDRRLDRILPEELRQRASKLLDGMDAAYRNEEAHRKEITLYAKTLGIPAPY